MNPDRYYFNIFGTDVPMLERLVATALSHGGDYCDLYFENTVYSNLLLKDGAVASGGCHTDYGVGIRVLKGEKTGYAYSETTAPADMIAAAKAASAIALAGGEPLSYAATAAARHDLYGGISDWREADMASVRTFLEDLAAKVSLKDGRIVKVIARASDSMSDVMMYNSLGELTFDTRPMGSVTLTVVYASADKTETKTVSRSFRKGSEMLSPELASLLAEEAVRGIDERFEARRPKGGKMPVVMGAGASGILLHEAMGHAFEADFNRKGQSIFSDRMGTRVCADNISIVDDGTVAYNRGSGNYDDEGVPAEKTYMVRDGILTSYLHDRVSAAWYGVPSTGNGRRESFRYNPIPRMRATYMESGDAAPESIISSVRKGIFVDEFSNGQVKIGEGDFTFFVKSGFLIENGRLTMPVKDINIIGNGPQALADITAVGNDLRIDNGTWTCGKEQSVPVTCGIPTVLVSSLTVGGE
ncbi:MAG: TldD/PmbA family protein [Candidatus Cryptobacteroides sp.]